ncbi:bifunctional DNA primase/polymerase [Candidatus Bipolaricaulota bacterium]|nr:bifunctional DNA primase/polymerase [Candidatus Bipolaricaulota bacterium]
MSKKSLKEVALKYQQELGLSIFPVELSWNEEDEKVEKKPVVKWKPFQEEKPPVSKVKSWWNRWPEAGIGVVTGRINDLLVLDSDSDRAEEYINDQGIGAEPTPKARTGSGGSHLYFRYPEGCEVSTAARFTDEDLEIDYRGEGGFVVAPPSPYPSKNEEHNNRYRWEFGFEEYEPNEPPEWLLDEIMEDKSGKFSLPETIPEGQRNDVLTSYAGKLSSRGIKREKIKDRLHRANKERCEPPLDRQEVDSITVYEPVDSGGDDFSPKEAAEKILDGEEQRGRFYAYVAEQDKFYRYRNFEGVWNRVEDEYVKKQIRNRGVEKKRFVNEIFEAFKYGVLDERNRVRFDPGKNPDRDHINFKNGILEWETGELKDHDPDRYDLVQIPHEYSPEATCPRWKEALEEWIPEEGTRSFVQEFIGYSLISDASRDRYLMLTGSGRNGKSTFLEVIQRIFGEKNLTTISLHKLTNEPRFETSNLMGTLINVCSDIDNAYIKRTGTIKKITSGETLRGEFKHGKSFDFKPFARLMFSANEIPKAGDKTTAWYRRMKIVKFPNEFEPGDPETDPHLGRKLSEEIPGIINWALDGLRRLEERGHFEESEAMQEAMDRYQRGNDSVLAFFEDRLVVAGEDNEVDPDHKLPSRYVYRMYKDYCESNELSPVSHTKFSRRLKEWGIPDTTTRFEFCEEHDRYRCSCSLYGTEKKNRKGFRGVEYRE